ncbi:MAG: redoxin domain-containing protein [Candidatus Eisenbacteria bacterium]
MLFGPLLVAASMFAAQSTHHPHEPTALRPDVKNNVVSVSSTARAPRTAALSPGAGEVAPDFTYQSHEYLWQNLHNILESGPVLLVFGAGDLQLLALEHGREALSAHGVTPLAVVDRRDVDAWTTVRRLNLGFSLLADPRSVIGEQYGVLDLASHRSQPAWFVIDRTGYVCQSAVGSLPQYGWEDLATAALKSDLPVDPSVSTEER